MAAEIGYPVILKASSGGGGRGMRIINEPEQLVNLFSTAQIEAQNAFGNGQLIMEKYLPRCRHIEVQVLGDKQGHVVGLGERDCTVQRRHQKLIEEAPSPVLSTEQRRALIDIAVRGAEAVGYSSAGTLEFLLDLATNQFFFIEMNTRIQVEHGVTEMLTGMDLVAEQIRIAAGAPLSVRQEEVHLNGHAMECRITAEDAAHNFLSQFGTIEGYLPPGGPGVRVDSHLFAGYTVPVHYDSLLSKVITWGTNRTEAIARMRRALAEYRIDGLTTTLPFHLDLLKSDAFTSGDFASDIVEQWQQSQEQDLAASDRAIPASRRPAW